MMSVLHMSWVMFNHHYWGLVWGVRTLCVSSYKKWSNKRMPLWCILANRGFHFSFSNVNTPQSQPTQFQNLDILPRMASEWEWLLPHVCQPYWEVSDASDGNTTETDHTRIMIMLMLLPTFIKYPRCCHVLILIWSDTIWCFGSNCWNFQALLASCEIKQWHAVTHNHRRMKLNMSLELRCHREFSSVSHKTAVCS